jgi:hypothetical protein
VRTWCIEWDKVVDHIAGVGARCTERALVVDHVRGFDADSGRLLDHVAGFDADSASRGPWWSPTWPGSARAAPKWLWWSTTSPGSMRPSPRCSPTSPGSMRFLHPNALGGRPRGGLRRSIHLPVTPAWPVLSPDHFLCPNCDTRLPSRSKRQRAKSLSSCVVVKRFHTCCCQNIGALCARAGCGCFDKAFVLQLPKVVADAVY